MIPEDQSSRAIQYLKRSALLADVPDDVLRANAQAVEDERCEAETDGTEVLVWFVAEILILAQFFERRSHFLKFA